MPHAPSRLRPGLHSLHRALRLALTPIILSACAGNPKPTTPTRPVATPAKSTATTSTTASLSVSIRPIGRVPFDSMTLPLTSPNGKYIASQHGATPTWPTLLADGTRSASFVPAGLRISAFEATEPPAAPSLTPLRWPVLPPRLLLGRSCNDEALLVEHPELDGSRSIEQIPWRTGRPEPLVTPDQFPDAPGPVVAAFATLGPGGQLACSLRTQPDTPFSLLYRRTPRDPASAIVLASSTESYVFPTFSADSKHFYVFAVPAPTSPLAPLAVVAIDVPSTSDTALHIAARIALNVEGSVAAAYQCAAALQTPWPGLNENSSAAPVPDSPLAHGLAFLSTEHAAMCWFDPATKTITPLAKLTVGAAPLIATSHQGQRACTGFLLGTARDLLFQPVLPGALDAPLALLHDTAVISGGYVPRLTGSTTAGIQRYLLLGPPQAGLSDAVEILEIAPNPVP